MRPHFLLPVVATALLLGGCGRPAENPPAKLEFPTEPPADEPVSGIVPIPEEFQTPSEPAETAKLPATLPVLFVTKDFQITTQAGIQGLRAGEAVNLLRETPGEYIVQYGDLEFIKEKEFFSSTFVSVAAPEPASPVAEPAATVSPSLENSLAETPASPEQGLTAPVATPSEGTIAEPAVADSAEYIGPAEAAPSEPPLPVESGSSQASTAAEVALPDEPPLPDLLPPSAEDKRLSDLTDAIRKLNDEIRSTEDAVSASGKKPTRAQRLRIEQLKDERDSLSRQLTKLGKP